MENSVRGLTIDDFRFEQKTKLVIDAHAPLKDQVAAFIAAEIVSPEEITDRLFIGKADMYTGKPIRTAQWELLHKEIKELVFQFMKNHPGYVLPHPTVIQSRQRKERKQYLESLPKDTRVEETKKRNKAR